jgi:hypothetical protein
MESGRSVALRTIMAYFRKHLHSLLSCLQRHSLAWTIGLGAILGLLIGGGALLSLKGVVGVDDQLFPANFVDWFEAAKFRTALSAHVGLSPCYRIDGARVEWDREADRALIRTQEDR